jgi:hypothetical protein
MSPRSSKNSLDEFSDVGRKDRMRHRQPFHRSIPEMIRGCCWCIASRIACCIRGKRTFFKARLTTSSAEARSLGRATASLSAAFESVNRLLHRSLTLAPFERSSMISPDYQAVAEVEVQRPFEYGGKKSMR